MYKIEGCPIPFHDLAEIGEFLTSLSAKSLMMFSGLIVYHDSCPLFWITPRTAVLGSFQYGVYVSYLTFPNKDLTDV